MYVNMNCQVAVCHSKLYTQTNLKERKKLEFWICQAFTTLRYSLMFSKIQKEHIIIAEYLHLLWLQRLLPLPNTNLDLEANCKNSSVN